jgi:hypothetical protein
LFKFVLLLSFSAILFLSAYLSFWAVKYRQFTGAWNLIDLRKSKNDSPKAISFCAALAENPIGFPGHAYVVWSEKPQVSIERDFSLGFMPRNFIDQGNSLVKEVPGLLLNRTRGNTRNLDMLTVLVSDCDFKRTQRLARNWSSEKFQAGKRDCVSFASFVASSLGLRFSKTMFVYPQDFLVDLKQSN